MGWDDNNYDYMSEDSSSGYTSDEGMDFGPNQDQGVNWDFGQTPDTSWNQWQDQMQNPDMYQPWQQEQLPGYDAGNQNFLGGAAATNLTQQQPGAGTQDFLGRLFSNPSLMAKGIGALFEGSQNKKRQGDLNSIAQRAGFDPFGSQRPVYQQALQSTMNDPYNQPMVKAQIDNVQRMQNIKDAAAGRRSNQLSSAPGVMAQQAAIAQNYFNSLQGPAGANISPNSSGLASILNQASQAGTNGYISPLLSVLGNTTRGAETSDSKQAAIDAIMKLYGKA
jgi:hypothetical protein